MSGEENDISVFSDSGLTNRTPPGPKDQPVGNEKPTRKNTTCRKCMLKDGEPKAFCFNCFAAYHITCFKDCNVENVERGTWVCDKCILTTIAEETMSDQEALKRRNNEGGGTIAGNTAGGHRNPTGALRKKTHIQNKPATLPTDQTSLARLLENEKIRNELGKSQSELRKSAISRAADLSTYLSRIGVNSTENKSGPAKSTTSSRLSTKDRLKLAEEENLLEQKRYEAEKKRNEAEQKREREHAEKQRAMDEAHFARQLQFLKDKQEILDAGSERSACISLVSSHEKRKKTKSWVDDLTERSASESESELDSSDTEVESVAKSEDNRGKKQSTKGKRDSTARSKTKNPPEKQFDPSLSWLRGNISDKEFLNNTLGANKSLSRRLKLSSSQIQARLVIPKELPPFSGDPKNWPQFITAFANSSHQCGFSQEENMARLAKCLKGDAYNAVQTDLLLPSSLPTALNTLRMLYGRPDIVFKSAMDQIRQSPAVKLDKFETLVAFSMRVKSFCDVVETAGMPEYLQNPTLLAELVEKLPPTMKLDWGRYRYKIGKNTALISVMVFNKWLRKNAETASFLTTMPMGSITSSTSTNPSRKSAEAFYGAHAVAEGDRKYDEKRQPPQCTICNRGGHRSERCRDFAAMTPEMRWSEVRLKNLCICCLEDHWVNECASQNECEVEECRRKHHTLLHTRPRDSKRLRRRRRNGGRTQQPEVAAIANTRTRPPIQMQRPRDALATPTLNQPRSQPTAPQRPRDALATPTLNQPRSQPTVANTLTQPIAGTSAQITRSANETRLNVHNAEKVYAHYQIVPVVLHGPSRQRIQTFAFLDGGSEATLLERTVADELGLQGVPNKLTLKWTNEIVREEPRSCKVSLRISRVGCDESYELNGVRTTEALSLPTQSIGKTQLRKLRHLNGLDIPTYERIQPRIIIGLDNFQLMSPQRSIEGEWEEPVAILTRLGWTLLGGTNEKFQSNVAIFHHSCADENLHDLVKGFFALESLGVKAPAKEVVSHEDERAQRLFTETVKRIDVNRYEAGLLWRSDTVKFPESRQMALHRLFSFEKKLAKDSQMAENVYKQMEEYMANGWLRKLSNNEARAQTDRTWYLPIFAVNNPNKPGKTRLVWDAAATVSGTSLNTHLLTGPDLMANLVSVLLKLREHKYAISGDIRQMFHQVGIRNEDQDAQRCLWRNRGEKEVSTYVMTVMTFGATCSPATAQFVKNINAARYNEQKARAVDAIVNRHYVDDYLDSFETIRECVEVTKQVTDIHQEGGFELRNFTSNSPQIMRSINPEHTDAEKMIANNDDSTKVLGMLWSTSDDTLRFRVNVERMGAELLSGEKVPTKRIVLRIVMMVFDPLGFLGFFIIRAKLILKEIWRTVIEWDETIKTEQLTKWRLWVKTLPSIETIRIPRCYFPDPGDRNYKLYVFVDASEHAAAAVVYIAQFRNGQREIALVTSKTKIAPNKMISIPRMELQAALMGARLADTVKKQQSIAITQCVFWSDSRNVLCWLRSPRYFKPFVAFRIGEILELTNSRDWRWVPTALNIADEATKWRISGKPCIPPRWYNGPAFLERPEEEWPKERGDEPEPDDEEQEVRVLHVALGPRHDDLTPEWHRFGKLERLVRTQVRILRFFYRRDLRKAIAPAELEEAHQYLIRSVHAEVFGNEIQALKNGQSVSRDSALRKLSPFIDSSSLIRTRSRLENVEYLTYEQRCPIVLPGKHLFTELLVKSVHEQMYHQNHATVLNELKQKFYIPHLRSCLKRVRGRCMKCKIRDAKPEMPEMAALPRSRTALQMRPFTHVGVDYFGPLTVTHGRRTEKKWGAIFTCMTTRAVHIELAPSLSSDSFILILRAFICRRGLPQEVYSDNGTNFRGAEAELRKILQSQIKEAQDQFAQIKWNFNPPAAPHMGGAWERLVRSIKKGLYYALPERNPSEDLLRSCLIEIESMINSRPLTYVETEVDSLEALTPNHFLLGSSSGVKPFGHFSDDVQILRGEWKRQQRITQVFWTRWVNEYLPTISQRTRWFDQVKPLQEGDVVAVVHQENPYTWQLGRVVTAIRSEKDGSVRQAVVRTSTGLLTRPTSKLAILIRDEPIELREPEGHLTGGSVADGSTSGSQ